MGKTVSGAIWLNKNKISDYDYYQFWRNIDDKDVEKFLKLFTKINLSEIKKLSNLKGKDVNEAKKILAFETTKICRGEKAANDALEMSSNIFENKINDEKAPHPWPVETGDS